MSNRQQEIAEAKATLEKYGYAVRSLWSDTDVQSKYSCTSKQALDVLEQALEGEALMEVSWESIDYQCEELGLEQIEDDNFPED